MRIHVVQKGDTLWKIARQYGISFEDLKRLNAHLANPDYIVPGMEIILPNAGKEAPSKQHVKEGVKEQPMVQQPVKERPVKEQPVKEKPVKEQPRPMPVPQPKPQPQFMMPPIELNWTHQAQPAPQPMHIDFFNMAQPAPNVNVQLDATQYMPAPQPPMMIPMPMPMPMPQPAPQPKPEPEKVTPPAPETKTVTQYVPVQVPVPVPVPHYIHPPCGCMHHHKKPCGCMHHHQHHPMPMPMPHQMPTTESGGCGCGGQNYPMEQFPMTQQPWGTMPAEMHGGQMLTTDMAGAQMAQHQEGMQGQMDLQMPHMNMPMQQNLQGEEMAGWAFPESSSFQSSSFLGDMNQAGPGVNQPFSPNMNQQWGPGPVLPMQNQPMSPYQQGWPTNPWMMPYS